MKTSKEIGLHGSYTIPIAGLSDGDHSYDFRLDDQFFAFFQNPDILGGDVRVAVKVEKSSNSLVAFLNFFGTIRISCDFCLEEFNFPIKVSESIPYTLGMKPTNNDDIQTLPKDTVELDLTQDLYDIVVLEIPIQKQHPKDESGNPTCDLTMLELLKKYIIE